MKKGLINFHYYKLQELKKDILFFDKLYCESESLIKYGKTVGQSSKIGNDHCREILATLTYLMDNQLLEVIDLKKIKNEIKSNNSKKEYEFAKKKIKAFKLIDNLSVNVNAYWINDSVNDQQELQKEKRLKGTMISAMANRFLGSFLREVNYDEELIPIISSNSIKDEDNAKKTEIVKIVIKQIPTPHSLVPLDEVISFKNDSDNIRRYKGLMTWINKMSNSDLSINEIEKELEYLTLDFKSRMQHAYKKHDINTLEAILKLPLEIVENLIKIKWSKIPGTIIDIKREKIELNEFEINDAHREIAYLIHAQKNFGKQ